MIGMISVILAAIALIMVGYLAVGFAGYLAFPRTVSSNVLKTFPDTAVMQVPTARSPQLSERITSLRRPLARAKTTQLLTCSFACSACLLSVVAPSIRLLCVLQFMLGMPLPAGHMHVAADSRRRVKEHKSYIFCSGFERLVTALVSHW